MKSIPQSGYFNTNKFARIFLESFKEITGENGLNAVLNYSDLAWLIENFPPDNLEKAFDFSNFSMIIQAMEEIYGFQGGRGLALRIGRNTFDDFLKSYGNFAGVEDQTFRVLPIQEKIKFGLNAMARVFSEKSDQLTSLEENEDSFVYKVERCPACWGRTGEDHAVCYYMVGLLKEGMHWVTGGKEFMIEETDCISLGGEACEFKIPKKPLE
jgi:predicted hydrocarbon binding protein